MKRLSIKGCDFINKKLTEATAQLERYKNDKRFIDKDSIKFAAIVFSGKADYELREIP